MNKDMIKRMIIYIAGILILALGLVLNAKTGLGVSPILSVSFVLSKIVPLTFGTCTAIIYCILVLIQILLYRKVSLAIILQLPLSYLFGILIDFYNMLIPINNPAFPYAIIMLLLAIVFTAIGAFLMVSVQLIVNPGDGYVNAFATVLNKPFGKVKFVLDLTLVCLSTIISFVLLKRLVGIGLGTIVAAFMTGPVIHALDRHFGLNIANIVIASKTKG